MKFLKAHRIVIPAPILIHPETVARMDWDPNHDAWDIRFTDGTTDKVFITDDEITRWTRND